jgi:hypothetical protein
MTECEAFKLGFFERVAEAGMTPSEFHKRASVMVKEAVPGADTALKTLGGAVGAGAGLTSGTLKAMLTLGLLVPVLGGVTTGKIHSMMSDVGPGDVKRRKQEQILAEYRRQAQQIRVKSERQGWRDLFKRRTDKQEEEELFSA